MIYDNIGNRDSLLQKVYETGFAMDDIILYLDTHPTDTQAMEFYHYAQQANQEAVAAYEQAWGPLMFSQVTAGDWNWINDPWPWEGGMD